MQCEKNYQMLTLTSFSPLCRKSPRARTFLTPACTRAHATSSPSPPSTLTGAEQPRSALKAARAAKRQATAATVSALGLPTTSSLPKAKTVAGDFTEEQVR